MDWVNSFDNFLIIYFDNIIKIKILFIQLRHEMELGTLGWEVAVPVILGCYSSKWCGIWNQSPDFKLWLSVPVRLGQTWEKRLEDIRFDVEWWILMIGCDFEVTWPLVN